MIVYQTGKPKISLNKRPIVPIFGWNIKEVLWWLAHPVWATLDNHHDHHKRRVENNDDMIWWYMMINIYGHTASNIIKASTRHLLLWVSPTDRIGVIFVFGTQAKAVNGSRKHAETHFKSRKALRVSIVTSLTNRSEIEKHHEIRINWIKDDAWIKHAMTC